MARLWELLSWLIHFSLGRGQVTQTLTSRAPEEAVEQGEGSLDISCSSSFPADESKRSWESLGLAPGEELWEQRLLWGVMRKSASWGLCSHDLRGQNQVGSVVSFGNPEDAAQSDPDVLRSEPSPPRLLPPKSC